MFDLAVSTPRSIPSEVGRCRILFSLRLREAALRRKNYSYILQQFYGFMNFFNTIISSCEVDKLKERRALPNDHRAYLGLA